MTFVRTKLKLERMQPGEVLSVRLRGEEPLRNVPRAAREEGHDILAIEAYPDVVSAPFIWRKNDTCAVVAVWTKRLQKKP